MLSHEYAAAPTTDVPPTFEDIVAAREFISQIRAEGATLVRSDQLLELLDCDYYIKA